MHTHLNAIRKVEITIIPLRMIHILLYYDKFKDLVMMTMIVSAMDYHYFKGFRRISLVQCQVLDIGWDFNDIIIMICMII